MPTVDERASSINFEELEGGSVEVEQPSTSFSWKKLWAFAGPGWLMSIAYLDPGNLESDLQAGAVANYSLIWVLFWATVMGLVFQILSVRLGVITGHNLSRVCRDRYPRPVSLALWVMTEIAIIGSDIQEVVGSAIAMEILFGLPLWAGVLITALDTFTFMFIHYFGVRKLEAIFAFLISVMAVCFIIEFSIGKPDGVGILKGWFVPSIPKGTLTQAVGMIGAVIMPHNLHLHSALVQSRNVDREDRSAVKEAIFYFSIESAISLGVSFFINMAVVAVFAKGFYGTDYAGDIGLKEAGDVLRDQFGRSAQIAWAIGLLAAGQSSTMTGTFAGQYVTQGFLDLQLPAWQRTLITRTLALGPAMAVAIAASSNLDALDENLNVLQSIQLPFAVLPVIVFNCDRRIVGDLRITGRWAVFLWSLVGLIVAANLFQVIEFTSDNLPATAVTYVFMSLLGVCYIGFVLYLIFRDLSIFKNPSEDQTPFEPAVETIDHTHPARTALLSESDFVSVNAKSSDSP